MPHEIFNYMDMMQPMGASNVTTKMVGEESPQCPQVYPPYCPAPSVLTQKSTKAMPGRPDCVMPVWECSKPKCAPTYSSGGCNYRLI